MALPTGGGNIDGGRLANEFGGFINEDVPDDRKVDGRLMNALIGSFYTGVGVLNGMFNSLAVTASSPAGMSVQVDSGFAVIGTDDFSLPYYRSAAVDVGIASSNTQARIDLVGLYMNLDVANRFITLATIEGTPAATPVAPTPAGAGVSQNATEYFLTLAQVSVAANATSITSSSITDSRTYTNTQSSIGTGSVTTAALANSAVTTPKIANGAVTLAKLAADALAGSGGSPTGAMHMFAGSTAPSGWLMCDGAAVSRTTYSALFTAIGSTFGSGDGSTTFNVPDMRRRVAVGAGGTQSQGPANTLGSTGGRESAAMPSHNHTGGSHTHTIGNHIHASGSHTHATGSHTHTIGSHSHSGPSHSHSGPSHTHTNSSHTHTGPSHRHGYTRGLASRVWRGSLPSGSTQSILTTLSADPKNTDYAGTGNTGSGGGVATGSGGTGSTGSASGTTGTASGNTGASTGTTAAASGNTGTASGDTGSSTGGSGDTDANASDGNFQPSLVLNYIIKH